VSTPYSGNGKGQLFTPEVGSQVLVGYEQSQAEFPLVLGNLFHPQNPQQATYTTPQNHLKGLQTAGGNWSCMGSRPLGCSAPGGRGSRHRRLWR
jgi:type VI secretion system secreted protein VgrG